MKTCYSPWHNCGQSTEAREASAYLYLVSFLLISSSYMYRYVIYCIPSYDNGTISGFLRVVDCRPPSPSYLFTVKI